VKFPPYVPSPVQKLFTALIEGDAWEPYGLAASLEHAEEELREIALAIEFRTRQGAIEYLPSLRRQEAEAAKRREMIASHINCLQRLVYDRRMRDAYLLLIPEISKDEQWHLITNCAYAADGDFEDLRERLKLAWRAKDEIGKAAEKLKKALYKFYQSGVEGPEEFHSIRALLCKTENTDFGGYNRDIWQAVRKDVLGEREREPKANEQYELDLPLSEYERELIVDGVPTQRLIIRFVSPEEPVEHDPLAPLRYGWEKVPSFAALVDTVAKAARNYKPPELGMISAGIESRQRNVKTQYVRALAYLLLSSNKFDLTNRLIRAIAVIATVVINLPDADVTPDDVRKALAAQIKSWKTQDKKED